MILDPLDFEKRPMMDRLRRLRKLARLTVLWENALRAFWRLDCWIGFFIALWLLQIPAMTGHAGEIVFWIVFLAGTVWLAWRGRTEFRWPDSHDADRRLEQAGGLRNRPLALIEDRLSNPEKEPTRHLWKQGREAAFAMIPRLRPFFPHPLMSAQDPRAMRFFVLILLVIGIAVAGARWPERIAAGLFPFSPAATGKTSDNIVLWITPPEYTGLPQITLQGSGRSKEIIDIAKGSTIKARVRGWIGTPEMLMKDKRIAMQPAGKRNWSLETVAAPTNEIKIRQGFITRARIPVNYLPDMPPAISIIDEIKTMDKGTMQIPVTVTDDYGVRNLIMRMKLDPVVDESPLGAPVEEARAMASAPKTETEMQPVYDLTWHPWAGLPVIIEMEAKDAIGQVAAAQPVHINLPERPFYHPVAKKLVELRKRLIWTPAAAAQNAEFDLIDLLEQPGSYEGDIVAFLSIRSMASRLHYGDPATEAPAIIEQLWDTALRIEEGNLTMASRDLRKAQKKLQDLLNDPNATDEQIAEAMDEMRQLMAQYMQEMFREMQKRMAQNGGEQMPQLDPEMFGKMMNMQDLSSFLDQLQAQALSGNRDAAQQLLSQLQQMMDNLDPSASTEMPPQMKAMLEQMGALKELIEKQQALLDRTQQEADKMNGDDGQSYPDFMPDEDDANGMPPAPQPGQDRKGPPQADTKDEHEAQEGLRRELGGLMLDADERLGDIPENMQEAESEMRGAGEELGAGRPGEAVPHQQQTLDHLRKSMEDMNQQLAQMLQQMTLMSLGMGPLDPLGRPLSEGNGPSVLPGSKVKIPDEAERKRVQEILKTLRQRSGDFSRPDYELEYYRRLMKQF